VNNRAFNLFTSTFFCLVIAAPLAILPFADKDDTEKRTLSPLPELKSDLASLQKFPSAYEAYISDHFGFRNQFLDFKSTVNYFLFRQSSSRKLAIGKNDWLFYLADKSKEDIQGLEHFSQAELRDWKRSVEQRSDWLHKKNITYRFVVVPDKHSIYPEMLPENLKKQPKSRLDGLVSYIGSDPNFIDLRSTFLQAKTQLTQNLYFKSDTHWNSYGAYVAYKKIVESVRDKSELNKIYLNGTEPNSSTTIDYGDLAKMSRIHFSEVDPAMHFENHYSVSAPPLPPLGLAFNQHTQVQSYINPNGKGTALIFHDSFMSALMPFINETFARVIYVWNNPDDDMFVRMVEQEHPDVVIEERAERFMQLTPKGELPAALEKLNNPAERGFTTSAKLARASAYQLLTNRVEVKDREGQLEILMNGKPWGQLSLSSDFPAGGTADHISEELEGYSISGWAGMPKLHEAADYVAISIGGDIVAIQPVGTARPDVSNYFDSVAMTYSGFKIFLPKSVVTQKCGEIRLFSIRGENIAPIPLLAQHITSSDSLDIAERME
jgi:hypothetical protein